MLSPYMTFPFTDALRAAVQRGVRAIVVSPAENNRGFLATYMRAEATQPATCSSSVGVKRAEIVLLLLLSFMWESAEHYLETQASPGVVAWFCGVEHWSNRLICDHLCVLLGYWLWTKWPGMSLCTRLVSFAWLAVHVLVLPNSMALHLYLPAIPGFFGDKTAGAFDVWSFEHVLAGVNAGIVVRWMTTFDSAGGGRQLGQLRSSRREYGRNLRAG
ncbi:MAG: hypothetical protein ABIS27_14075 [Longimicrobiales bacterium]